MDGKFDPEKEGISVDFRFRVDEETHLDLLWGKHKKKMPMTIPFVMTAEREAEKIVERYGKPPAWFRELQQEKKLKKQQKKRKR